MHQIRKPLRRIAAWTAATTTVVLASASPAYAADAGTARLTMILNNATAWVVGILAVVATLFLTLGGVRYVMAGGDPGELEKAKGSFKSAVLGYALAALAPVVVLILKGILGVK
jgi:cytochrome c oxidase assembly factor CtaG